MSLIYYCLDALLCCILCALNLKLCLDNYIFLCLLLSSFWSTAGTQGNAGLDTLMGMLSGLGAGGGLGVPNTSNGLYTLPTTLRI
jgi:hypothetical protein